MSTLYEDLPLTNFPSDGVDTFPTYLNVTATDGPLIQQYMEAMNASNQVLANQILAQIPAAEQKIIKATDLNKVMQATLAVERFYKDDIYDYIAQEQQNWENIINQFTYKGIYSSGNTYQKYNMVGYTTNGSTLVYIAIQDVPTGNAPLNETFWRVMTIQGQEGEPGVGLSYRLEWNPATQYEPNQAVTYDGVLWMALQTNINVQPGTDDSVWEKVLDFTVTTYPIQPTQPTNLPVGGLWFNTEGNPTQYYYLTPLQSPASAGEIGTGYQAYDSEGNVIVGTATLNGPTYTAGDGIEITGDVIGAKISTDANNKVEFGIDGGLFVDTGVDGAIQGNFVGFGANGQLVDSGSKATDFAAAPLGRNLTLYVNATTGSDSNDGLAPETAKSTITGALNTLPSDLGSFTATIKLYGGTLTADTYAVNEGNLRNGVICIDGTGMDSGAQIVGDMRLAGRCDWELTNVRLKGNHIDAANSVVRVETIGGFTMYGENVIDGNSNLQNGILILSACATACVYGVTFTNCAIAVSTIPTSYQRRRSVICAIGDCSGINNYTGIYASHASLIYDRTAASLGNTRYIMQYGGLIVNNSGNFVKE